MPKRNIVVVGTSSGGVEALRTVVASLPADFQGSMFLVMHIGSGSLGLLPSILARVSAVPVISPSDGESVQPGRVYVASPDRHLLLEPGQVCLSKGPKENWFRPAIDPLFRSAALAYGPRVVGVVLTGELDDGSAGLWTIKQVGGVAVVQDPLDALFPSMPRNAIHYTSVDYKVPLVEIGPLLGHLTTKDVELEGTLKMPEHLEIEVKIAKQDPAIEFDVRDLWEKSSYTCPECDGVLLKLKEGGLERYRCHTGHAYSTDTLLAAITEGVEESLWSAIRQIEERVLLLRHIAKHLKDQDDDRATEFLRHAEKAEEQSRRVREVVNQQEQSGLEGDTQ